MVAHAKQIRILSVEDHPVFRQGLATIIETQPDMALVGQAANGVEAIAEFRRLEDAQGTVWIGKDDGLFRATPGGVLGATV